MTEKEKKFLAVAADHFNALLILLYAGVGYFLVCAALDGIMPRLILTVRTAHDF